MKAKHLARLVDAEVARRAMAKPILLRTLTIDFEARTFGFDGATYQIETRSVSIPILNTEQLIVPSGARFRDPREAQP